MWVFFYFVASFCVAGSLACGGCKLEDATETICSDTTNEYLDHNLHSVVVTSACSIVTNGNKFFKEHVNEAKADITGHVGNLTISMHYNDMCEARKNHSVNQTLKMLDIPECNTVQGEKARERHIKGGASMLEKHQGSYNITAVISKINGVEGKSVCIRLEGKVVCDGNGGGSS